MTHTANTKVALSAVHRLLQQDLDIFMQFSILWPSFLIHCVLDWIAICAKLTDYVFFCPPVCVCVGVYVCIHLSLVMS